MKILLSITLMLMFKFCYKETPLPCEEWEYTDECILISASAVCNNSADTVKGKVCGTGLAEARDGKTTLLINDPDKKVIRHYIRKI